MKVYFFVHAHQSLGLAQDDWGDVEPRAFNSKEAAAAAFMEYVDKLKENEDVVEELNYDEEDKDYSEVRSGFAIFGDGSMEWFNIYECDVE